jgi:hypothetical protein
VAHPVLTELCLTLNCKNGLSHEDNTGQQNLTSFFVPRGKISNPDNTFNGEFKYVSSFSPSPTVFFVTAKLNVKKSEKMCIFTYFTRQQNLTFFGTRRKISVPNGTLTLNSNM